MREKVSKKEKFILDYIAENGPSFGLDMVVNSDRLLKRGVVYVTLGRMEEKGLLRTGLMGLAR